ncbi:MAG: Membrane-associated phospholipid phosphatase [Parcubacteria bacterium C7867-005]|nr:MAG: Membrane-associated phospholipid phosphatase [Parcubacteria bacterium C7867-005]
MLFRNWAKNLIFLIVYILSGLALVIIIDGLITGSELLPLNTAVSDFMMRIRHPILTGIMVTVTNVGSPLVLSFVALILAIVVVLQRDTYDTLLFIVSILLSIISFTILKNAIHLPRPTGGLITPASFSFPSGHATVATAFFFAFAHAFFGRMKTVSSKVLIVLFCVFGAGAISISRLYLGAHFALDVLAGTALGILCVSFSVLIFSIFLEEKDFLRRKSSL